MGPENWGEPQHPSSPASSCGPSSTLNTAFFARPSLGREAVELATKLGFAGDGEAWAAYGSAMLEADRAARNAVVSHPYDQWRLGRNLGARAICVLHARFLSAAAQRTNDPSKGVCDASNASARRMAGNARRTRRVLRHISSTSLTNLARSGMIALGVTFAGSPGGRYEFV